MKNKVKTIKEFDKHLLDKKASQRDRKGPSGTSGTTLVDDPPAWAIDKNQWGEEFQYGRVIEGWEKLCIEAYFSGWVDFFDTIIYRDKIDHTIYFQWGEMGINGFATLKIYFEPGTYIGSGPQPLPMPPTASISSAVPKPPPPPIG